MRLLSPLLCWLVLLAPAFGQNPIIFSSKKGLVRSGATALYQTPARNLLSFSSDLTVSAWWGYVTFPATVNDATHVTFTSQYSNRAQNVAVLDGVTYTFSCKIRRITGNTSGMALILSSETGTGYRTITIDDTTKIYSATFYRTGGGSVGVGIQDRNASGWGQIEVTEMQVNEGAAALPYVATTDGQSYPNLISGGASLQRGSTSGADTSDPTRRGVGLSLDGVDDLVASIPAAGATYTKTFCSSSECYTLDSAGNEYVNGAVRVNKFRWSESLSNTSQWVFANASYSSGVLIENSAASTSHYIKTGSAMPIASGTPVTISAKVKSRERHNAQLVGDLTGQPGRAFFNLDTCSMELAIGTLLGYSSTLQADGYCRISISITSVANPTPWLALSTGGGVYIYSGDGVSGMYVKEMQLSTTSSLLPYQRTEGAAIPALGTAGGYTGLFAGWGQWSRILGAGEIIRDYFRWWRPQINGAGGTLP